jgi:hypothetical protein
VRCCLIVVVNNISLMTSVVEHLYVFWEISIQITSPILIWVSWGFFCPWVVRVLNIFQVLIPCQKNSLQIINSHSAGHLFTLCIVFSAAQKVFGLVQSYSAILLLGSYSKNFCPFQHPGVFSWVFFS